MWLIPAALAVMTAAGTGVFVYRRQPDYPVQLMAFQIMMVAAAMLVAARQRWVRWISPLVLLGGAYATGMSVGALYVPTIVAAGFVVALRLNEGDQAASFLDRRKRDGIFYTESELDAINSRIDR